uniref:cyclin-dependent kinase n=1 Tax=Chlamydomonas euryale TaxID=1486919 RepID=A0A7R9VAN3_9CHLO|mmetsp:Transcript_26415/g.78445  ORF Transcript_26415/g.78445 Transcript_26415/m.78445 type:complete len:362 (+) Transcript_26415:638-1723(+)
MEPYEFLDKIAEGAYGSVWKCVHRSTGRFVAVKRLKDPTPLGSEEYEFAIREVKLLQMLNHVNVVQLIEAYQSTRGRLYLVFEYVEHTMLSVLKTAFNHGQRLTNAHVKWMTRQLLAALSYMHSNNIIHRDLKPSNVLVSSAGTVKLCDFGFAKHWLQTSNMNTMRIGTPEYMGPELISSRTGYDGVKVDVWAAGVLLYVMLVGVFPFETQDDNFSNTAGLYDIWLQQIKTSWREAPNNSSAASRLSPELKDMLDRMFEVKQDARIDVAGIRAHPWLLKPLPKPLASALKSLEVEQAKIDTLVAQGAYKNSDADKMLEAMLEKAAAQAMPTEQVMRVPLSKVKRSAVIALPDAMGAIKEDA